MNGEALDQVRSQAAGIAAATGNTAALVEKNTAGLEQAYAAFVEKVGADLRAQADQFERNISGVMGTLNETLARLKTEADRGVSDGLLQKAAQMQMTMDGIRSAVESLAAASEAAGKEG